jgi:hypothetical protein
MSLSTIITAVIVLGIVWGGFVIFLFKASSYEKKKKVNGKED